MTNVRQIFILRTLKYNDFTYIQYYFKMFMQLNAIIYTICKEYIKLNIFIYLYSPYF